MGLKRCVNIFNINKTKCIITFVLLFLSLCIPIVYTVCHPNYTEQNTLEDHGKIISYEVFNWIHYSKLPVYTFDNGNKYYIPNGVNSYVDSFGFSEKGTELTLRYNPKIKRYDAYMIVSLSDDEETFLSIDNTNRHGRMDRLLFWLLYILSCIVFVTAFWLGDIFKMIESYKRYKKKRKKKVFKQRNI